MSLRSIKYAIAAGHEKTTEVAETILASGGNAFDAAVAAYLASFVTEPVMASAGAGGFANIFTSGKKNFLIDFFCQTPKEDSGGTPSFDKIEVDFGESTEVFYAGAPSMAVPGAMALISFLAKRYCSMPLKELVQPAMGFASEGVEYTPFQAEDTGLLAKILLLNTRGRELFLKGENIITKGDVLRLPKMADFLETFAKEKEDWFYRGEIAKSITQHAKENNGYLKYSDFRDYEIIERAPFTFQFQNKRISTPPLPSLGGGLMHLFLSTLENSSFEALSRDHFFELRKAFDAVIPYTRNPKKLYDKIAEGEPETANAFSGKVPGGTSHLNIIDQQGNAIALSTSIGTGSGYFIPGTDMQMNNMLGEPALMPDGLNSWRKDVRLNSMMCPTFCFNDQNELEFLIGTGGSTRIPFSIAQVLVNKYKLGLEIGEAIHLPRVYENLEKIYAEKGFDHHDLKKNKDFKEWDELNLLFGGTHSIDLKEKTAIGDTRREGNATVKYH